MVNGFYMIAILCCSSPVLLDISSFFLSLCHILKQECKSRILVINATI